MCLSKSCQFFGFGSEMFERDICNLETENRDDGNYNIGIYVEILR